MRLRTVCLLFLAAAAPASAQDLLLENARIVDPAARTVRAGNILITAGRIADFPASAPANFRGRRVDLQGRWVIPALTDMHTHSFGNAAAAGPPEMLGSTGVARVALAAGVARYLDLFSPEDQILTARNDQRAGRHGGADILASGPCLTATRGHCSEYGVPTRLVDSPADAVREVTALAAKQPDVVKVVYDHASYGGRSMPSIDRATLDAVVRTAREHGLKTVVHVGTWADVRDAVEAGAAAVTHTPGPDPLPDGLADLMASRGTYLIPTLAVQSDYARYVDDPALLDSKLLARTAAKAVVDGYRQAPDTGRMAGWLRWQRSVAQANLGAVATLFRAGVPMLTGTDGGNPAIFQGYSVHRELRLLADAGLTPWDALAASTINAGRFFDRQWGMTTGAEGTLVVLDRSPIDDIRNSETITAVIQRGKLVYNTLGGSR